jgi:mono/diheme cytochrome c family protein
MRERHRQHRRAGSVLSLAAACAVLTLSACNQAATTATAPAPEAAEETILGMPAEEFGEFMARPEELAAHTSNDIVKSLRLNGVAMKLGRQVYDAHCASCHGAELKGGTAQHTPDLTDAVWQFSGDDLDSGGVTKFPSDVEWTVRYGIRSGHRNARGLEVDMLAYDPQYRNARDTADFGSTRYLTDAEIEDVAEYVLQIGGQPADAAKARRGAVLFQDNAKGNCFDCHGEDATGNPAFGSTDLTQPKLYLYGSDRASILESINRGRVGTMPAFEGTLKDEEIKAVAIYVLSYARQ